MTFLIKRKINIPFFFFDLRVKGKDHCFGPQFKDQRTPIGGGG